MPEPVKRGERYTPGLDGLRAIAVLGVVFYHLGFGWAEGGLLGVGVFFTLSGLPHRRTVGNRLLQQLVAGLPRRLLLRPLRTVVAVMWVNAKSLVANGP